MLGPQCVWAASYSRSPLGLVSKWFPLCRESGPPHNARQVALTPDELKKSSAGREPLDAILMFRMLVLQALNNLSDEQVEYQVRDRLSFSRFLAEQPKRRGIQNAVLDREPPRSWPRPG